VANDVVRSEIDAPQNEEIRRYTNRGRLKYGNPAGDPSTAPRCGAKTRSGPPCRGPAVHGKRRCRMHGGNNPGPPKGSQNALKHGRRSAAAVAERKRRAAATRDGRALIATLKVLGDQGVSDRERELAAAYMKREGWI